jgi:hypothetical protein
MGAGQVSYVDVVANACPVGRGIVVTIYVQRLWSGLFTAFGVSFAGQDDPHNIRDEVGLRMMVFP